MNDQDFGDVIVYTSHGGQDPGSRKRVADQTLTRQTMALVVSLQQGLPVRVVRGPTHRPPFSPTQVYRYDGLYIVDLCGHEKGAASFGTGLLNLTLQSESSGSAEARPRGALALPTDLLDTSMIMQSVVEFGASTHDGRIIRAVTLPWFDIVHALQKDPGVAFRLTPRQWEELIAGAYERAGFDEVILTPRSGDLGRDVIAVKHGLGTIRIIDQVKAYKPGHLVNADDVRALFGVVIADRASKGFLTTTSDFAPRLRQDPLIADQLGARIELVNGTQLLSRLRELAEK